MAKKVQQNLDRLFAGRDDCFGVYVFDGPQPPAGQKRKGHGISYPNSKDQKRKLEQQDWLNHTSGTAPLGIVPVFIDGTCKWFSIDVDDYGLNHTELARSIAKNQLPIIHCRSKSGGAHLYAMISEPVEAKLCVELARKWCETLGFDVKKTEVFPKQTKFDSPEAKGNWIIVPYFGGEKADDFAIDEDGKKVKFEDFEQYCLSRTITPDEFNALLKAKKQDKAWSHDEILAQSPPCMIRMMEEKIKEGDGRNNAASHMAWYYRQLDEFFNTSEWQDKLADFNTTYFDPPLAYTEFAQVIKNHSKGKYQARCTVNPMLVYCDKKECLKRKFGIGKDNSFYGDVEITAVTKIETGSSPYWRVYINGQQMTIDNVTLGTPRLFKLACLANLNIVIPLLKQNQHDELIAPIIKNALTIEESDLISTSGKIFECFRSWVGVTGDKAHSKTHVIKNGIPYIDYKENEILFKLNDFVLEYRRAYREMIPDREIYLALKANSDCAPKQMYVDNKRYTLMVMKIDTNEEWLPERKKDETW